jgi:hypothetical protein
MRHAASHSSPSSSTSTRISSAMPMEGCVSFSWMAFFSANWSQVHPASALNRTMMSAMVAHTKKYCCFRRSSLPLYVESDGYSTEVMVSARCRVSTAFM